VTVLKPEDKPFVREVAREVGDVLMTQFRDELKNAVKIHSLECPTAKTVERWTAQMRVIVVMVALFGYLLGAVTAPTVMSAVMKVF
jgi:hypothetical protein